MDYKREDILKEFLAKYNRGEIEKEQYLNQKKALVQAEKAEKDAELQVLSRAVSSLALQIEEIEEELQK